MQVTGFDDRLGTLLSVKQSNRHGVGRAALREGGSAMFDPELTRSSQTVRPLLRTSLQNRASPTLARSACACAEKKKSARPRDPLRHTLPPKRSQPEPCK